MSDIVSSFAPVMPPNPRLLILGSMPGVVSLRQNQYYANSRNAFWPIMAELLGVELCANYRQRVAMLYEARIALWDVLKLCRRSGSLDSAIESGSEQVNDISSLLNLHRSIHTVATNGGKASQAFKRHIAPVCRSDFQLIALPSTSPANARMSQQYKLARWREKLADLL